MRENMGLYRGKRTRDGVWIEGPLLFVEDKPAIYDQNAPDSSTTWWYGEAQLWGCCEVDPETVGEFTGMTDIGGNRIFEGDIMKTAVTGLAPKTGAVLYQDGAFCLRCTDGSALFLCFVAGNFTVIGNIHDTPVLTVEVADHA